MCIRESESLFEAFAPHMLARDYYVLLFRCSAKDMNVNEVDGVQKNEDGPGFSCARGCRRLCRSTWGRTQKSVFEKPHHHNTTRPVENFILFREYVNMMTCLSL